MFTSSSLINNFKLALIGKQQQLELCDCECKLDICGCLYSKNLEVTSFSLLLKHEFTSN